MFEGKSILVTGGTGSIGQAIVKKILGYNVKVVRVLSRDQTKQYYMQNEHVGEDRLRFLIGDIRDRERLKSAMKGVDIIFHAAALKHVDSCEYNPFEAVKTNVVGTQNIIDICFSAGVERLVLISTDKATVPENVMGTTKLLAEKLIVAAHSHRSKKEFPIMCTVRFGNVIGSAGSIIPLFLRQLKQFKKVWVTDPYMTRFVMSISDAVDLVFKAVEMAEGGETFVLKMPSVQLKVLVEAIIELYAEKTKTLAGHYGWEVIGRRKGEKMHERLLTDDEASMVRETNSMFILDDWQIATTNPVNLKSSFWSHKRELLDKDQIKEMIKDLIYI